MFRDNGELLNVFIWFGGGVVVVLCDSWLGWTHGFCWGD